MVFVIVGRTEHSHSDVLGVHADMATAQLRVERAKQQQRRLQTMRGSLHVDLPDDEFERQWQRIKKAERAFEFGEYAVGHDCFEIEEHKVKRARRAGNRAVPKKAKQDARTSNG